MASPERGPHQKGAPTMAERKEQDQQQGKHEKALDLSEEGVEMMLEGDEAEGKKLVQKAKKIDPSAVDETMKEFENSANSSFTKDQNKH
jgi:hypothetical protein